MSLERQKIGKYLLLERLSSGGMGELYLAKLFGAASFEKLLAVKRLLPTHQGTEEAIRLFEYEALVTAGLNHPNLVHIYDFFEEAQGYFLAMEYISGTSLARLLELAGERGIRLSPSHCVHVINEVCKGLAYAHSRRHPATNAPLHIVHRDISPQNIMLSFDGVVKIVDFGIAKGNDRPYETRQGVIRGKLRYMSPEQVEGKPVDCRSDIYACGVLLFELLTQKQLFQGESDFAIMQAVSSGIIPRPSSTNPEIPQELDRIVLRALARDPVKRYQSADHLHRDLQSFLNANFPSFTPHDLQSFLSTLFAAEIEQEKKRVQRLTRERSLAEDPSLRKAMAVSSDWGGASRSILKRLGGSTSRHLSMRRNEIVGLLVFGSLLLVPYLMFRTFRREIASVVVPQIQRWFGEEAATDPAPSLPISPQPCTAQVTTDPQGASVLLNDKLMGKTPFIVRGGCGEEIRIKLELEGHESVALNYRLEESSKPVHRGLESVATGTLTLSLNEQAKIFVNDELQGEVRARQSFNLVLPARKSHRVRFVNERKGIDVSRIFLVEPGAKLKSNVNLLEK